MNNKWKWIVVILLVALLLASGAVVYAQARPVAPEQLIPGLLLWDMPTGAKATLVCNGINGYFEVVTQTLSTIEVECRPWVLGPGD